MKSSNEFYASMKYGDYIIKNTAAIILAFTMWLLGITLLFPSNSRLILVSAVIVSGGILMLSAKILVILHGRHEGDFKS